MTFARNQNPNSRLPQPGSNNYDSLVHCHRPLENTAIGNETDESDAGGPRYPYRTAESQGISPPRLGDLVISGVGVVGVYQNVHVWNNHRDLRDRRIFETNSCASSSSSNWFSLLGSMPGLRPRN